MSMDMMTSDVRVLMDRTPFDKYTVADLHDVLGQDPSRYRTLQDAIQGIRDRSESLDEDAYLRLGVGYVLLGNYRPALEHLSQAESHAMAWYYRGLAHQAMNAWTEAAQAFGQAAEMGYEPESSQLQRAGALHQLGQTEQTRKILEQLHHLDGHHAEYHHQRGVLLASEGEMSEASIELEKALELDREHTGVLFRLAYINDLYGNDNKAIELYQRCTSRPPVPLSAFINLGILYEDENRIEEAKACYNKVLSILPNHPRAQLFHRDCLASDTEVIDTHAEYRNSYYRKQLSIPVTDFELSVRSRNCLKKMHIRSLGDLTRITERALLDSKNFGETSLSEIKEMMTSKNLKLGMALEVAGPRPAVGVAAGTATGEVRGRPGGGAPGMHENLTPEEREIRARPISDLNLSVRARKCMSKLNLGTVGDLVSHTSDQLLECKNFGVTSLNEVRTKLNDLGVKLKGD